MEQWSMEHHLAGKLSRRPFSILLQFGGGNLKSILLDWEMSSGKHTFRLILAGNAQHREFQNFQSLTPIKYCMMTLNSSIPKKTSPKLN